MLVVQMVKVVLHSIRNSPQSSAQHLKKFWIRLQGYPPSPPQLSSDAGERLSCCSKVTRINGKVGPLPENEFGLKVPCPRNGKKKPTGIAKGKEKWVTSSERTVALKIWLMAGEGYVMITHSGHLDLIIATFADNKWVLNEAGLMIWQWQKLIWISGPKDGWKMTWEHFL